MFNNASDIDASHSTFTEIHHDQYNSVNGVIHGNQSYHTIVHGNQIYQNSSETFEPLRKASILSVAFDSAERYPAPICLPGTRVEILNRISGWIEDEGSQPICWLSGLAGSGKSAIAQRVAEMYAEKNRLAASFFFSRREQQRSTTQHFFPTLSSQLLKSFPSTKQSIAAALDEDYTVPTKFLREQMQKLVLGPLCAMTERPESPVLIVVDSLDECDNEGLVVELIALLAQLLRQCPHPFRLLLTSRIEPHIQNAFREPSIFAMTLFLELATFDAQEDIRSFMAHAFDNIYEQHHMVVDGVQHPWPSTDELEKLLEKASGLFIFATTVVKFVGSKHHDPSARLQIILNDANISSGNTIYADLDSLYHDAVQAVNDADLVQFVLGIIRYVSNPLSIRALNIIISPLHIVNVAHILPDLGSVLLVPEDEKKPVRIYHTSFRDFLSSLLRAKCYFVDPSVYHPLLARLCLEHMCGTLKKDMCDIGDPSMLNSEVDDLPQRCSECIDEATRYACHKWSYHLARSTTTASMDESLAKFLVEFSRKSILHWVETLSLLGAMDIVITMLHDAISWLKLIPTPPEDTLTLFKDTQRLALMFFDPISQSSLHVYYSALPLTPTNSILRKYFQAELTGKLVALNGLDSNWDGCVRTIDVGDAVHSVAFSPTDGIIASATAKHGAQLWNTTTGVNIVTLGPPQKPSAPICFSPSGACVALAFESGLVAVWDSSTAQPLINNDECHRDPVTSLKFSPDNTTLASASRDKSVQLWHAETGKTLHRLLHEDPVTCLAFSADNKIIVSGCQGGSCSTWDVESGQLLRKLRGHSESVNAVAISGDGVFIASGSDDKAVRVWDSKTGVCMRTYAKGHKGSVIYVRFTPDNSQLISVCRKYVVSWTLSSHKSFDVLWSAIDYVKKISSHSLPWLGTAIKLMPTRLAVYVFNETVASIEQTHFNIGYSPDSSSFTLSLGGFVIYSTSWPIHNSPPSFIASADTTALNLTSDGSQVASGNGRGSIQLWDSSLAMKNWSELSDSSRTVFNLIGSSSDGNRHFIEQNCDLVLLGPRAEVIKKLSWSEYQETECLFSENSYTFACCSEIKLRLNDGAKALRVYKSLTGDRLFRVVVGKPQQIALSPDGTLISCAHDKGVLEVWDVLSGKSLHKFPHDSVQCIRFAPDNSQIACGTPNGKVHLWDLHTGDSLAVIEHGTDGISCLSFSPDSNRLAYGCGNGSLHFCYPLPTGMRHTLIPSSEDSTDPLKLVLFSPDGTTINCRTSEGTFYAIKVPAELLESGIKSDDEPTPGSSSSSVQCDICKPAPGQTPSSADSPADSIAPNPHIKFMSDKSTVRDAMFRSDYEVRFDGWVYDGDRRILWLPAPFRPRNPFRFHAYKDMLAIMKASGGLFINLAPIEYRNRDLGP